MDGLSRFTTEGSDALSYGTEGGMSTLQQTLKTPISCTGIGLHRGKPAHLVMKPAPAGTGILFRRTDITDGRCADLPARWDTVVDSRLCTTLGNKAGVTLSTVEHLMAAAAGLGVDNLLVEVDGPELPIMDGSSAPFVFLMECAGLAIQESRRQAIRVLKPVTVTDGPVTATLAPAERGLSIDFEITFKARAIGRQTCRLDVTPALFRAEIARARTFGLLEDVNRMRDAGLGLGGSLDNAVVVDDDKVLNDGGLRFDDEFVRHKALDAIGDLALAGLPLIGAYRGVRSSHAHNNRLLRALFADKSAWRVETLTGDDLSHAATPAFSAGLREAAE